MICTKCNNDGILNHANGKEFYYCRTCKDEIMLEENTVADTLEIRTGYYVNLINTIDEAFKSIAKDIEANDMKSFSGTPPDETI